MLDIYIAIVATIILIIMVINGIGDRMSQAELDLQDELIEEKNALLYKAAGWFRDYATNHYAKDTAEAFEKGRINDSRADQLLAEAERD